VRPLFSRELETRQIQSPRLFAVHSWGNAGVVWVGRLIGAHPECLALPFGRQSAAALTPAIDGATPPVGLVPYFEFVERLGVDRALAGSLGDTGPGEFAELTVRFGNAFRGFGLIGHPIIRAASSINFCRCVGRSMSFEEFAREWGFAADHPILRAANQTFGPKGDYIAAHYLMHVNGAPGGSAFGPLYDIQELMVSAERRDEMLGYASDGALSFSGVDLACLLERYVGIAHGVFQYSLQEIWDAFAPEVRQGFRALLTEEARAFYADRGYDLSLLA